MIHRIVLTLWLACTAACMNRGVLADKLEATMTVTPGAVPANGISTATAMLRLSASGPDLATDIRVIFQANNPNTVIVQPTAVDANGWYVATLASRDVGTQEVTAMAQRYDTSVLLDVQGLVTFNAVQVIPGAPSAQLSTLTAEPNLVSDDGQSYTTLTLRVIDGNNVPVPAVDVTFASTGTNNFFSSATGNTGLSDASGILTTTLASTTAETKTITAHAGMMAVSTQVTFSPVGASGLLSSLQANPNTLTADGVSTTTLTLTVLDTVGLPLPSAAVTWASTGSNNTWTAQDVITDANGMATATLASSTAEVKTITASSGGMQVNTNVSFVAGVISSSNCTFVANPNLVVADNSSASTLTFTAMDSFGNPIANAPVSLSVTGTDNTVTPGSGLTNAAGAFVATLASGKAELKTVTATSGSVVLMHRVTFLAGPPSTTLSVLTASPNVVTADGASRITLTLILQDAQGNPASGQAVTFSSTGSNDTFAQPTGVTDASGQFSTTLSSTTAEDDTVIASFTSGSVSTDVTFVSGPPASSLTTLLASPATVTADGTSSTTLTTTVRDAFGNPVAFELVTLSATGSNNALVPASGTTDSAGVFTATMASTTAEVVTITAMAASATANASVTFVAGVPSSTTTTFVASPTSVTADGASQSTLTVTVEDAQGNPVANQAVSIASTGTSNTLSPPAGSTNSAGVFSATLRSTKAETKNLTATIGSITQNASVVFVAGAPAAATTTLVANPNTLTADGSSVATLSLTVLDAQGNPVADQAVSLGSTGSNNFFGGATGTTNSAGVYTTTLASNRAEVKTVTSTVGSVNASTTVTFVAGVPNSANCSLTPSPTSVVADGNTTSVLTFVVRDAFGNPVANQAVTLTVTGTNNTLTPASGTTDSIGHFVATLASTTAEVKTATGTAAGATASSSVTFNPGAVSNTTTALVANPNTLAADGSSTSLLVTTARDAQGNPVPGQTVSLTASGGNNVFTPATGSTDANGMFSATLASTLVQSETVTTLVGGIVSANANVTFIAPIVNSASSTIVASPNVVTADGNTASVITVTVLNNSNAPVIGAAVVMSATGTANSFSPTSGTTDGSGVFTTNLTSTEAAAKTIIATVDGTALQTTVTFSPGTPVSTTTTLTANPNTVTADGTSTSTLTVVVKDVNGNRVPNQGVSLALSGGNNTLTPGSGTTDATGTFTATLASTLAQTETATATVNGFNKTALVTFVPGAVNGATTTLVANPNTATADGNMTITLTATVKDAEGNPVPNQAVVLASTGSNNVFAPPSGNTNSAGVFVATLASTKAQFKVVTATIGTVNENANVLFVAGPASSMTSTLALNPTSVTANGNTTTVTVTVKDANGNLIANQNVSLSASGSNNTFTPVTGSTNGSGVFTAALSSTTAQTETITAALGTTNLTAPMTFTAGAPSGGTSSLVASPTTLVANGVATATLSVSVKDAFGNAVPNQSVALASSGVANTISPTSGTTNGTGVFTATFATTTAQVKLVTATLGAVNETATVTFTAGTPANANTVVTASPTSVTADGASTTAVTVTVEDAFGNPVGNQNVTLSSTGSNNTFSPLSGTTNNAGVFSATLASTRAEVKTVTATVGALTPTATVTFTAGAATGSNSQVSAIPGIVTANGTNTTAVTVTVKDAYGNLVPNQAVSVAASGTANTWGSTAGTTNGSGVWSTTLASTLAQSENITATIGAFTETTTVSFVAGSPNGTTTALSASPASLVADGAATTALQVTVEDAQGNLINGQTVTFSSSGSGYTFSSTTCTTNSAGVCSVTLRSTVAQTVTVNATCVGLTKTTSVTFTAGPPNSGTSTIAASPTSLTADGGTTTTLTVTAKDATGNLINGQSVTLSSTGSLFTLTPASGSTNGSGVFTATMSSTKAEVKTVTATMGSAMVSAAVTFVAGSPNALQSSFTALPSSVTADGATACNLTLTLLDAYGNGVSGQTATFSGSGTNNTITPVSGTTNASGTLSGVLKSTKAQVETVTVKTATLTFSSSVTFTAGAPSSATSTLTASPNSVWADGTSVSTLTFLVEDAQGNPISGQPVSIASTGGNNTFSATSGNTTVAGTWTVTLASSTVETKTITATAGTMTSTTTVVFTVSQEVFALATGVGADTTCALLTYQRAKCWGANDVGELGLGDILARGSSAAQMGAALPFLQLGTGRTVASLGVAGASCAVLDNGALKCWGGNGWGQLGLGDTTSRGTSTSQMGDGLPALSFGSGRTARAVAPGSDMTCAVLDNGSAHCWGDNSYGELGLGDTTARLSPATAAVALGTGRTAQRLSAGPASTCAILDNAQLKCWGFNVAGELGLGDGTNRGTTAAQMGNSLPAISLGTGRTASRVSVGGSYTPQVWFCSNPPSTYTNAACTPGCSGSCTFVSNSLHDYSFVCAVLDDGTAKCWGDNSNGELGLGDALSRGTSAAQMGDSLPAISLGTGRSAVAVVAGTDHACALLDTHDVKCWGANASGQLGMGDTVVRGTSAAQMGDNLPIVNLGPGRTAQAVVAGKARTCALLDSGAVTCWGANTVGQLGLGDTASRGNISTDTPNTYPPVSLY